MKAVSLAVSSLLIVLFFFSGLLAQQIPKRLSDVQRITVTELQQLQVKEPVVIVDTRAPGQWLQAKDKLPGAIRVTSYDDLVKLKNDVPAHHAIVTYCT